MRPDALGVLIEVDLEGVPFKVGQLVKVIAPDDDDSMDGRFSQREGRVVGFIFDDPKQVPTDPLVVVEVPNLGQELFFVEELRVSEPTDSVR